jgi:hypothetical protein
MEAGPTALPTGLQTERMNCEKDGGTLRFPVHLSQMERRQSVRKQALLRLLALPVVLSAGVWAASGGAAATAHGDRFNTRPVQAAQHPAQPGNVFAGVGRNVNITNKTGAQSETSVAVDPTDPNHMLAEVNDLSNFSSYNAVYESTDRGRTWVSAGFSVAAFCYDPWVNFNAAGDAFVGYECSDQRIAYRLHGTTTWHYTTLNAGSFPDRDTVKVDTTATSPYYNSVYVGYDDNGNLNRAYLMYSRNGQTGWTKSSPIDDTASTSDVIGVNPQSLPNGDVSACWEDYTHGFLKCDLSHDGGATWGTDVVATDYRINTSGFFIYSIPAQAVRGVLPMPATAVAPAGSPNAGRLYVAYFDKAVATSDTDMFVRHSDDGGLTWAPEVKVNDDTVNAYQFHPAISVASNGTVGVSFYDTRNDPGVNKKTDRYVSYSTNGGDTWTANTRVSKASSDETVGSFDSNQYGDYEGMGVSSTGFFELVWCDSRPGTMNEDMVGATTKA